MTDDIWGPDDEGSNRRPPGRLEAEMDRFDDEEFGGPLFGDTAEQPVADAATPATEDSGGGERLSLTDDTGSMPHWTEAATG